MSLSTYTGLLAAVANTLHRADLASALPDLVTLAEDKLNKRLRLRAMESRQTASVSSEYVALPDGFLAMRNLQLNTSPRTRLEYATPEWLDARYPNNAAASTPKFYTFIGGEIQLAPPPGGTYTLEMDFYEKLDLASDGTNWVLTNAPRLYYYGALLEAAPYLKDDKRVSLWSQLWENAIQEVEKADQLDKFPTGLQMRPDVMV